MRNVLSYFLLFPAFAFAQIDSTKVYEETLKFQDELNKEYNNPKESPLPIEAQASFTELPFYPISMDYVVEARFEKFKKKKVAVMESSTSRMPEFIIYGKLHFELLGDSFSLTLYQSPTLKETPGYEDYLFLPFTDETCGESSYGGGRYIDFRIPKSEKIILNFNKAYNPYCAYSDEYSCPIPPKNNFLAIPINAGVMYDEQH